jgi:hypothetical protein
MVLHVLQKNMIYYVFDLSFRNSHGFVSNCVAWLFMFCKTNMIYYVLLHQAKFE